MEKNESEISSNKSKENFIDDTLLILKEKQCLKKGRLSTTPSLIKLVTYSYRQVRLTPCFVLLKVKSLLVG